MPPAQELITAARLLSHGEYFAPDGQYIPSVIQDPTTGAKWIDIQLYIANPTSQTFLFFACACGKYFGPHVQRRQRVCLPPELMFMIYGEFLPQPVLVRMANGAVMDRAFGVPVAAGVIYGLKIESYIGVGRDRRCFDAGASQLFRRHSHMGEIPARRNHGEAHVQKWW